MGVLLILPCVTALVLWFVLKDPKFSRIMILMLLANIATFYQLYQFKRVKRLLIEHNGKVCGNCLFPLDGLDDEGVCPECGHPYEINQTIEDWRHDLALQQFVQEGGLES